MKGQVFTVAKLHYINGIVYLTAQKGTTNLQTLADNSNSTTKSGKVKHPLVRVRTLARLAQGIGLVIIAKDKKVQITDLGREYYKTRTQDTWAISNKQAKIMSNYILADPYRTETIYSITALFNLVKRGYTGRDLANRFAIDIGKDKAWKSDVTYKGFTDYGLNYINELGLMKIDDKDLLLQDISQERIYQEKVNDVQPIIIPEGKLPKPKPRKQGNAERYQSNPRRSKIALIAADFKCELNQDHSTFTNKISGKPFMEAHHLIPMSKQGYFRYDIDVPENILSLRPNCHRKIHLAEDITRIKTLKSVYVDRKDQLIERGINTDFSFLINAYGVDK